MSNWRGASRNMRDSVTIPTIWVAIALSLLIHVAVMWQWLPRIRLPSLDEPGRSEASGQLRVRLAPPPGPPPAPPPSPAQRTPPLPTIQAQPAARPPPAPPVIALNRPAPDAPAPPPAAPSVTAPTPARPPGDGDLASHIEARRRARAEPVPAPPPALFPDSVAIAPPAEDDHARANRLAAANLALRNRPTFGYDPAKSGGIFQIMRMGYEDAEFIFFGWNKEIRRNTAQQIEVRKGSNSDIRIAVVRRMIAIIREYEQEDFLWESRRLNRNLMLSARARDNAGLEEFMMREFFDDPRLPR
jgi:hypothetical protein